MLIKNKQIILLVLSVSCTFNSTTGASIGSTIVRNVNCPPEGLAFLPGPKCKLFYFCSNGFATMLQCREEENYNPKTELCDEDYICYDSPASTTAPTTTTTVTSESPTSGTVSVLLPHQQCPQIGTAFRVHDFDCSLYFYCRDSVIRIQQCPFLHYFDMFVGRCLFRTEVQCYPGTEPEW